MTNHRAWTYLALLVVLILGIRLRSLISPEGLYFGAEHGRDYLEIATHIANFSIPWTGPPSSHAWLYLPPLFYWFFTPVLLVGGSDPLKLSWAYAFFSYLIILLHYVVTRRLFSGKIALISTFFLAISPAWIDLSYENRHYSLVPLFFYPFYYFLSAPPDRRGQFVFLSGFFLGLMVNFHLSALILVVPALVFLYLQVRERSFRIFRFMCGLILPLVPWLIWDLFRGGQMLTRFALWLPYRFLGLFRLISPEALLAHNSTATSLNQFLVGQLPVPPSLTIPVLLVFVLAYAWLHYLVFTRSGSRNWVLMVFLLDLGLIPLLLHGGTPSHYFLPLYPLPLFVFAWLFSKKLTPKFLVFIIFTSSIVGLVFLPRSRSKPGLATGYPVQNEVAGAILADAGNQAFNLKRIGAFDNLPGYSAQNYKYLLWWQRGRLQEKSNLIYIIYDGILPAKECAVIYRRDEISVVRGSCNWD